MTVLELFHLIEDHGLEFRHQPDDSLKLISGLGHLTPALASELKRHKAFLVAWKRALVYKPGHLLPLDLGQVTPYAIYHYPLLAGCGILQVKARVLWQWYVQGSPDRLKDEGDREDFERFMAEQGVHVFEAVTA